MTALGTRPRVSVEEWFETYELYTRYADALDAPDLAAWLTLFTEDCLYRVMSAENDRAGLPLALMRCEGVAGLADRVHAIEEVSVFAPRILRHIVSGLTVTPTDDGTGLDAQASFVVLQSLEADHSRVYACGRYRDRLVRVDGRLRFATKLAVHDGSLVVNSMVYPL